MRFRRRDDVRIDHVIALSVQRSDQMAPDEAGATEDYSRRPGSHLVGVSRRPTTYVKMRMSKSLVVPAPVFYFTRVVPEYRVRLLEQLDEQLGGRLVVASGQPPEHSALP